MTPPFRRVLPLVTCMIESNDFGEFHPSNSNVHFPKNKKKIGRLCLRQTFPKKSQPDISGILAATWATRLDAPIFRIRLINHPTN